MHPRSDSATTAAPAARGHRKHLPAIGSLYVAQYLGVGFLYVGLTAILRADGAALERLGALQLLGIIWAVKFLWAPLVDRFGSRRRGHYRSWLLITQPLMVIAVLALMPWDSPASNLTAVMGIAALYVLASATQDVATDALAARLVPPEHRGEVNGLGVAGSWAGNMLGGGLVVVLYHWFSWQTAIIALAVMVALPLLFIIPLREPRPRPVDTRAAYRSLRTVWRQTGCKPWAFAIMPLMLMGGTAASSVLNPALVDAGWSLGRIGIVLGVVIGGPAILGAFATGRLISRYGRRPVFFAACAATALATLALWPTVSGWVPLWPTLVLLSLHAVAMSAVSTIIFTVSMDFSRDGSEGSDFTVLASFATVCQFVGGFAVLTLAAYFGYQAVLVVGAVLLLVAAVIGTRMHFDRRTVEDPVPATPVSQVV